MSRPRRVSSATRVPRVWGVAPGAAGFGEELTEGIKALGIGRKPPLRCVCTTFASRKGQDFQCFE